MAKTATLEIHQLNVGQGDSTLVVVRDAAKLQAAVVTAGFALGTGSELDHLPFALKNTVALAGTVDQALLIDGGDDCYGMAVRSYMESVGALDTSAVWQPKLTLLATHYHDDHQEGLRCVMRDPNPLGGTVEKYRPFAFYKLAKSLLNRDKELAGMVPIQKELKAQLTNAPNPTHQTASKEVPLGGYDTVGAKHWRLSLGAGPAPDAVPITVTALSSDQAYCLPGGAVTAIPNRDGKAESKRATRENCRSIVLVIEYGSFRHFCGGDITGPGDVTEADIETPLAGALGAMLPAAATAGAAKFATAGHCCTMKMNHHGANTSNSSQMFAATRPRIVVGSSGCRRRYHRHPTTNTVDCVLSPNWTSAGGASVPNTVAQTYVTEIVSAKKYRGAPPDLTGRFKVAGTIVIRPTDQSVAAAQKKAGAGSQLEIQMYGDMGLTPLPAGSYSHSAPKVAGPAVNSPYPSTPVSVSCGQH